jgi:hypothetical protein
MTDGTAGPPDPPPEASARSIRPGAVGWRWADSTAVLSQPTEAPAGRSAAPARGPRRSRWTLKYVDPWTVLKVSFLFSLAAFVVFLVAVTVVYAVLAAMGVFDAVNSTLGDLTSPGSGLTSLLTFGHVLGFAAAVGAINTVLFTALATLGSFIYNLCASLVGGIEVVLSDQE